VKVNPISIECPKCKAEPYQRCRYSQGTLPRNHKAREVAALAMESEK
jgi:hypothetical protein